MKTKKEIEDLINQDHHNFENNSVKSLEYIKYIINNGLVSKDLLGFKVSIPNPYLDSYLWEIIGINHDGTENTIDLRSCYSLKVEYFDNASKYYKYSISRRFLNGKFYDKFDDQIKSMIMKMNVISNNEELEDYVKIISMTELGLDDFSSNIDKEGNKYKGKYAPQSTRTRHDNSFADIWIIDADGSIETCYCQDANFISPIIRLGKETY